MPEFSINGLSQCIADESEFVAGFIQAMFFTEVCSGIDMADWNYPESQEDIREGRADGSLPSDCGYENLHPDSLKLIREFCERKQKEMAPLLALAYEREGYDAERAGMDLLYTFVGHGVGYWSRPELDLIGDEKAEYERLSSIMVECGIGSPERDSALSERNKLISLGDKLTEACGSGEVNPWFGDHVDYGNAPFVHVYISG